MWVNSTRYTGGTSARSGAGRIVERTDRATIRTVTTELRALMKVPRGNAAARCTDSEYRLTAKTSQNQDNTNEDWNDRVTNDVNPLASFLSPELFRRLELPELLWFGSARPRGVQPVSNRRNTHKDGHRIRVVHSSTSVLLSGRLLPRLTPWILVRRRPVNHRHGHIEESQVDPQLSPVMDHVVQHRAPDDLATRHRQQHFAAMEQAPGFLKRLVA